MELYEWCAYDPTDEVCLRKLCGHSLGLTCLQTVFSVLRKNPLGHVPQSILPFAMGFISPAQGSYQDFEYSSDFAMNVLNRGCGLPGLDLNSG